MEIYLGTVALERNRWTTRVPTVNAAAILERAECDGFSGAELWEEHYTKASEAARARLAASGFVKIFNCYIDFASPDREQVDADVDAVTSLRPRAVKYNLGKDASTLSTQLLNLRAFRALLPDSVELLCECHPGTLMEDPDRAGDVLDSLGYGYTRLVHTSTPEEYIRACFERSGSRITHIHAQNHGADGFKTLRSDGVTADRLAFARSLGFNGSVTLEFTRGDAFGDEAYEECVSDLAYLRAVK